MWRTTRYTTTAVKRCFDYNLRGWEMSTHHSLSGYSGSSKNTPWAALRATEGYPNTAPWTFIVVCSLQGSNPNKSWEMIILLSRFWQRRLWEFTWKLWSQTARRTEVAFSTARHGFLLLNPEDEETTRLANKAPKRRIIILVWLLSAKPFIYFISFNPTVLSGIYYPPDLTATERLSN